MHITKIDMTCTTCFTKIKLWTTIQLKKILFCSYWCELLKTRVKTVDHPPPPPPLQQGSRTWKVSLGIWITIVWFQKISIPPPQEIIGNSEGEGGFKGSNFRGVWGVHGKLFSERWQTMHKTLKATYNRSEAQKHTYVRCFETKVGTPGHWHEVNIISFNVSVFLWVS